MNSVVTSLLEFLFDKVSYFTYQHGKVETLDHAMSTDLGP